MGDSHRLMQVLVNLLGNAIKFTESGQICLRVQSHPDGVAFDVIDTGIGIETDRVGHLFQHFEQVHALQPARYAGHGLGLAISKRLVEIQKGHITVHSIPGQGSTFSVVMPFRRVSAPPSLQNPIQPVQRVAETTQFLVVDDHPLNRLLVRQILLKIWAQAHLDEAEDGSQALAKMRQHPYDIVLMDMDMDMPVMDGIEASQHIRQQLPHPASLTPILGLTANVNPVDKQRCLEAGMNHVVDKPFNRETLVQCITNLLPQASASLRKLT